MREEVEIQLLQRLFRLHGGVRSRIVMQEDVRLGSATSLIANVIFESRQCLHVPFGVDGSAFTQELNPERALTVEEEGQHDLSTMRISSRFQWRIRALFRPDLQEQAFQFGECIS